MSNYIYIDKLSITFQGGLNVIIGESGSGKSIVVEGLLIALGAKLQSNSMAMNETDPMVFSAEFSQLTSILQETLAEKGFNNVDSIIIRRVISKDRKSRYYLNDVPVAQDLVRALSGCLLEYTGQSANFSLLSKSTHIKLLDSKAASASELAEGRVLYHKYKQLSKDYNDLLLRYDNIVIERDYLEHAIKEMRELAYESGEEEVLVEKRKILNDQKALIESAGKVRGFIEDSETVNSLIRLKKDLTKNSDYFDGTISAIDATIDSIDKIESELDAVLAKLQFEDSLEEVEDRLYKIRSTAKKYQTIPSALQDKLAEFESEISLIANIDENLSELKASLDAHIDSSISYFKAISAKRVAYASQLEALVNKNLCELRLEKSSFKCSIESDFNIENFSECGFDDVEFLFKTIPSKPYESLVTVASGGELSRIVLALKLALEGASDLSTMIFDEIDTGISGQTAISVADKLKDLSAAVQLITITHQPYLAAKADNLIYFEKSSNDNDVSLNFKALAESEREHAIAKMISGDKITADSINAAKSLIDM